MRLFDFLKHYSAEKRLPFHMPGHKRSCKFDYLSGMSEYDITEIEGFDNLHAPSGILKDAMGHAASVYGSDRAFFLVNGSTGGILASIYTLCRGGRDIIMARGSHRSAYNAATICGSTIHYITPSVSPQGFTLSVTPNDVRIALDEHPDSAAVTIVSPTYEGVISDIAGIANVCHERGVPLIVDAAHGAHLGFLYSDISSPVACGADITIMSVHKTLPSLTQTALLHVKGNLVDQDEIAASLAVFESSSPSYLLMASIDGCMYEMKNDHLFSDWRQHIELIEKAAKKSRGLELIIPSDVFAFDKSKILLSAGLGSGAVVAKVFREKYHIEPEMVSHNYVILMTGGGDSNASINELCSVIENFPSVEPSHATTRKKESPCSHYQRYKKKPSEALLTHQETVIFTESIGRVAAEYIIPYPPGIPLLVPGEIIEDHHIKLISDYKREGLNVVSSHGDFTGIIYVIKE